ncbi:MAG: glycerophosphodiester phosphodiesterase [Patescibacteria group bacterium]
MKIIGHRGAAGSELENTLASIQAAIDMGVYAVEIDIRKTKDNQLVVCHDSTLTRVSDSSDKISDLTLKQLQKIPLHGGAIVPTLSEVLELVGEKRIYIEVKQPGCAKLLIKNLAKFPNAVVHVVSFKHGELEILRMLAPELNLGALERTKLFDVIHLAKRINLNGVGLNYWILNPLTYYLIKRAGLDLYVYTVNNRFQAKFLSLLYPDIAICTDYPERFIKRRGKAIDSA